jgi:antitoxin component YwqK of YwqJK toxin-antitoxin module
MIAIFIRLFLFSSLSLILVACSNNERYYYETGELLSIVEVNNYGKNHGTLQKFYKSGELEGTGNYTHGKKDGLFVEYYESGKILSTQSFKDGVWIDTLVFFYEKGNIKKKTFMKGDFRSVVSYHQNGHILSNGDKIDTLKTGWWNFYTNRGKLHKKAEFKIKDGRSQINQFLYFDKNDQVIPEKSNFYKLIAKDSLKIGEESTFELRVQPHLSKENDFYMVYFSIRDSLMNTIVTDSTYGKNNKPAVIKYKPTISGNQQLNGFILEKGIKTRMNEKDTTMVDIFFEQNRMYFEKRVFVE